MENQKTIKQIHEQKFNQKAVCIWLTGLSGAGKSTLAVALQQKMLEEGFVTQYLDGDLLRNTLNNNLGFSDEDRLENIRRVAEVTKLFLNTGIICINAFISPTNQIRNLAKLIIGEENFIEIYLNTSLETCESRDPKGLYAKARKGELKNFTGIDAIFEAPDNNTFTLNTDQYSINDCVEIIYKIVIPKITIK
jgi:adenylylsulfate kinase